MQNKEKTVNINEIIDFQYNRIRKKDISNPSLFEGDGGDILFLAYYKLYTGKNIDHEIFDKLEKLLSMIEDSSFHSCSLTVGLGGITWLIDHLKCPQFGFSDELDIDFSFLDHKMIKAISFGIQEGHNDPLHGYLGIIASQCYRNNKVVVEAVLESVLDDIEKNIFLSVNKKIHCNIGINQKLNSLGMVEYQDYGLAHGVCGLTIILLRIFNLGFRYERLKKIIFFCVDFLRSRKSIDGIYPSHLKESYEMEYGRQAWCYGELCYVIVFLEFSKTFNDQSLFKEAIDLTNRLSYLHDPNKIMIYNENGHFNLGFCHGIAGLAFIYDHIWTSSGNKNAKICSDYWHNLTISQLKDCINDDNLYGLHPAAIEEFGIENIHNDLLNGFNGICLSLVALNSPNVILNQWKTILML